MKMIKYRTRWQNSTMVEIKECEVVKETAKQVVFLRLGIFDNKPREEREAKHSDYQNWFDTWEEAHEFCLKAAKKQRELANQKMAEALTQIDIVLGMKKPK